MDVTLLCRENPGAAEINLMKIIKFMGGSVRLAELSAETAGHPESLERVLPRSECLIASADTLAHLSGDRGGLPALLAKRAAYIFVYGFGPAARHGAVLRDLTANSIEGVDVISAQGGKMNVAPDCRAICRQFSGISFDAAGAGSQHVFKNAAGQGMCSAVLSLNDRPFLVRSNARACQWLLLANEQIPDLDAAVPIRQSILEFFPSLVPVLMFLRSASSAGFWHNDRPAACFIIDDPLLKRRYGFLDFQKLGELMDRKRFSTSIAFIPWNHRRSDRRVAELFASRPRAYSLCVHGCDHTRGEFGGANRGVLREKAQQALEWMNRHREFSGVAFDDVMVFPQGIFSTTALRALRSCNYLAAVNSSAYPVDAEAVPTLRDLLQVAMTRFSNFPLFTRRYPQKPAELAFDLFLGKPALVVEHHGFFRDGYEALAETVDRLQSMEHRLQWSNLESICSRACLEKTGAGGEVHVQFFTNRFSFRNDSTELRNYCFMRRVVPDEGTPVVTVDGRPMEMEREDNYLKVGLSLAPNAAAEIKVDFGETEPKALPARRDALYQAKVFIRRCLSEFRDNYVDVNPFLSRAVRNRH